MMAECNTVFLHDGIVFGAGAGWWGLEVERHLSSASKMVSLGCMAQQGLDGGCGLLDVHRARTLSGIMVL
jgi:hypothetical protein